MEATRTALPEVLVLAPHVQRGETLRIDANHVAIALARCFETSHRARALRYL